ncbi:aspartate aminotransferase family protein [Caproiciproducens faecalis]|uniref:Acetylornithine aminotransferase n=1 Tax=Caproiciproducens faecalis TaxID=2820301 RepID=A0ABS7DQ64_9FIRM|nr:aspartate aminotransferase family protein [Caproiciproducens faecalis]MBW7572701.1 aspartate aminotransferase family protein [Caproiciproducens faecalis]
MTFEEIQEQDRKYLMQTYGRFPVALVSGHGATAVDCNGKEYIDFTSGIGVNSLGYCDERWTQAVAKQAATLQHTSNLYYQPMQTKLAEKLCTLTGFSKVFFGNSGAEANECAVKVARKYAADKYGKNRCWIVTLQNSFHGRTLTTLAATGQDSFHEKFTPLTEGFSYAGTNMDSVKENVTKDTCAVMIELVQGEGGVLPLQAGFVKELSAFCAERDILLLVDEVQTGVGRTGKLYCFQNYGIMPDILTSAKGLGGGLPIGACLCGERLGTVMDAGSHGSTFGGNPVVCAGALAVLDVVGNEDFLQEVGKKGAYLTQKLSAMEGIELVRGMGMMLGAKLKNKTAKEIAQKCAENGLLVLTAKEMLRFLPPLTIMVEDIDKGLAILEKTIQENS